VSPAPTRQHAMTKAKAKANRNTDICAEGEFHVDLYTLPDNLIKMLWDFTTEKVSATG